MRGVRWLLSLSVLGAAVILGGRPALAQFGGCTITATPVAFGIYDVFSPTSLASTGSVRYQCEWIVFNRTVYLSKGSASSNSPRQIVSGSDRLNYNLYLDAAHTQIWGDPSPYSYNANGLAFFPDVTLTVYGLIFAGQDVPTGNYSDFIVATINF
jgi:spore coat protein U-like protein